MKDFYDSKFSDEQIKRLAKDGDQRAIDTVARFMTVTCPKCGSGNVWREEIDVGVGYVRGPYSCPDCGWAEYDPFASLDDLLGEFCGEESAE